MSWIEIYGWKDEPCLYVKPAKTDRSFYETRKIRNKRDCSLCRKKLNKGTLVFGANYGVCCIDCGLKNCEKIVKQFKEEIKYIEKNKKEVIKNKEKIDMENTLVNL